MSEEMVTITKAEYDKLKADADWLGYLYAAGIDNTDAFSIAAEQRNIDKEAEDA